MTKDELINELETGALADLDGDTIIIIQTDAEGNGHSPLADLCVAMYEATTPWSGDTYVVRGTADDPEDEAPDTAVKAIVLAPMN